MSDFSTNNERPSPQLALLSLVIGLFAGLAYWALLRKLGQPANGIHIAAIGVCAAITVMAIPRLHRLSPQAREMAQNDPAVREAGSFGAYLDKTYSDMPSSVLIRISIIAILLGLFFIASVLAFLIVGDPEGALSGSIALSAFFILLAALPARVLWRRRKAQRRVARPD